MGSQQNSLNKINVKRELPDTDRPGDRGADQSGPNLFSLYGSAAFQLAFGAEERDRADAMSAFASSAIDILVKPFDAERFQSALELARSRIAGARMELEPEGMSSDEEQPQLARRFLQRLAVEANEKIVLVRVDDIRWMQSSGNYIRLHVGKTSHLIRRSMKNLQTLLDPNRFLRVHRNAIVNLDHVEEFHLPPNGNMFVKLDDGLCLPLRKANRASLRKLLKDIW